MGRKGKVENDMKKIKIAGKEYILEFTFEAAEIEECVKRMVDISWHVPKQQKQNLSCIWKVHPTW